MRAENPPTILLKNYRQPDFWAKKVDLVFDLGEEWTTVTATVHYVKNDKASAKSSLHLDGSGLKLVSVRLDGRPLTLASLEHSPDHLIIPEPPREFVLECVTHLRPQDNTALEGLYKSGGKFCTQCEPEGFRRITYFLDRPDVMAIYETTLIADKTKYPVLLSNGNLVASGDKPDGKHFATWHDPFPKPSYLFALVAGDLVCKEDTYRTKSGRNVGIRIYVEAWNAHKCDHAMYSVKAAMKWDEDVYGLEYDLDVFMIVAVSDFNMGAMENKGLNIFNAKYILADPKTATDSDFEHILSVVGHEYFHNWTGNRVTCRDWFQLCLKEGLTVFRDQEFSSDLTSRDVVRIENVAQLRTTQFPEDTSPLAHPIRPESYIEINNFYTATVYEKGSEVIRMLETVLGRDGFRKAIALYFKRHDGQAVTTEDFLAAMADANGMDLEQFSLWYRQAGTPTVEVRETHDAQSGRYTLTFKQTVPPTPGQPEKRPHVIPCRLGLLGQTGEPLPLNVEGASGQAKERVLLLRESEQSFTFTGIKEKPVPSLFRGFSAPVMVKAAQSADALRFLMRHDTDGFNRYEAGQKLAIQTIQNLMTKGLKPELCEAYSQAFGALLEDRKADPRLLALALTLPSSEYLISFEEKGADIDKLFAALTFLRSQLAKTHEARLQEMYESHRDKAYSAEARAVGRRSLKNVCLQYLFATGNTPAVARGVAQYRAADNMTDTVAALGGIAHLAVPEREELLGDFYRRWKDDALVLNKWFSMQAGSHHQDALAHVVSLTQHPDFDYLNPNRVYSVFGPFGRGVPTGFHHKSGDGYRLLADFVLKIDPKNANVAARLVSPLARFRRFTSDRADLMRAELERMLKTPGLSRDVYEQVSKSLNPAL